MKLPAPNTQRTSRFERFARELDKAAEANPPEKSWLPWPKQTQLTPGTRRTYRTRINSGGLLGPDYEAAVRAGYLYARRRP